MSNVTNFQQSILSLYANYSRHLKNVINSLIVLGTMQEIQRAWNRLSRRRYSLNENICGRKKRKKEKKMSFRQNAVVAATFLNFQANIFPLLF
jgi:DNA replication protein DnaC